MNRLLVAIAIGLVGCGSVTARSTDDGGTGGGAGKDGVETGSGGAAGEPSSTGGSAGSAGSSGGAGSATGGITGTGGTGTGASGSGGCAYAHDLCNGVCVDITTTANCGICGRSCGVGHACLLGSCTGDATGGTTGTGGSSPGTGGAATGGVTGTGGSAQLPECPSPSIFSSSVRACLNGSQNLLHRNGYDCWICPDGLPTECWFPNAAGLGDPGDNGLCVVSCSECS